MPFVIGVINRKGGVGKSSIACTTAWQASRRHGQRVLLIDMDHDQGDATLWLLGKVARSSIREGHVYRTRHDQLSVVWVTEVENIPTMSAYDVVVVDGRPSGEVAGAVLGLADVIVMPYCDATGHAHAVRLGQGATVPAFTFQNAILGPSSTKGKNNKRLMGYDPAIRSRRWERVKRDFYADIEAAYDEVCDSHDQDAR